MRIRHTLATAGATLGLMAASVVGATGPASAGTVDPTTTAGAHTAAVALATAASTTSSTTVKWNNTTWTLTVSVTTGQLAAGSCVTGFFDWRSRGHHDARALRDCRSNDTLSYSFTDSNTSNLVAGFNRLGLCYGVDDQNSTTCANDSTSGKGAPPMDWTPWPQSTWSRPCSLSWVKRAADGTTTTFIDAHSQRRLLVGTSSC